MSLRLVVFTQLMLGSFLFSANAAGASANMLSPDKWRFRVGVQEGKIESETVMTDAGPELHARKLMAGPHDHGWWHQEVPAIGGEIYNYSFEAKASADEGRFGVSAGFELLTPEGGQLGFKRLASVSSGKMDSVKEWKTFKGTFVAPHNVGSMRLRFSLDAWVPAQGSFRNVSITRASVSLADLLDRVPAAIPAFDIEVGPVSAKGVTLTPNWSLDGAETLTSATRLRVCLNALWAVQPADEDKENVVSVTPPKAGDWAFFKVPGFFDSSQAFLVYGQDKTSWAKRDMLGDARVVWYVRDVALARPVKAGSRVYLTVTGMRGLSFVAYWNGRRVGTLTDQLGGRIDLTDALGGDPAGVAIKGQLALQTLATNTENRYAFLMEAGAMERRYDVRDYRKQSYRGFTDIYLDIEPAAKIAVQDNVQVIPSFRQKRLDVLVAANATAVSAAETARYEIVVRDRDGREIVRRDGLRATPDADTGKLKIGFPWENPRLWTPDEPSLYTLTVAARDAAGRMLDETFPIRFGFREIWVNGKDLMLNSQVLRLRPRLLYTPMLDGDSLRRQFSFMKDMGFNSTLRPGASDVHEQERNGRHSYEEFYRIADEMGIMVIPFGFHSLATVQSDYGANGMTEDDQKRMFAYMDRHMIRPIANHPSVIGWSGFGSGANYVEGLNSVAVDPEVWGITALDEPGVLERRMSDPGNRAEATRRLSAADGFVKRLKTLDPSRPYFGHFDGGTGDVWGIWSYFNWTPLQEWEQWPDNWSKRGTMPIGATEHGFPYASSFLNHGIPDGNSEPWVTEYSAIDLGPTVFAEDTAKYLDIIRDGYDPVSGGYTAKSGAHHAFASDTLKAAEELVQKIWVHRNHQIYRAWRTYGVSTGIEPFGRSEQFYEGSRTQRDNGKVVTDPSQDLRTTGIKLDRWSRTDYWPAETMPWLSKVPTGQKPEGLLPLGEVLYANNRPLLVYIAGEAGRFASKDHVFWGGETINKQIAAIWDGFTPRDLSIRWQATLDAADAKQAPAVLGSGTIKAGLSGGEIKFLPLSVKTPLVGERTAGRVAIEVFDSATNQVVGRDTFDFTLYPENSDKLNGALAKARVVVLDPSGDRSESLAALRAAGLSPSVITSAAGWRGGDLLVIGKGALGALSAEAGMPAIKLPAKVPVFVMEQTDKVLEAIGLRVYPARHRTVFATDVDDPVLNGIEAADLKNWRVTPDLLAAESAPLRDGYLFHAGYDGTLVSVSIEAPTRGGFTPFLQCGFDLRETAVLQTIHEGQRWIFSQLSLTDAARPVGSRRGDPVATRLLRNLLSHALEPQTVVPGNQIAVLGTDDDVDMLRELGAPEGSLRLVVDPAKIASERLALVGNVKAPAAASLKSWVMQGGTAVVMPQSDTALYDMLSPGLKVQRATTHLVAVPGKGQGSFEGLGQSNFHYRQALPLLVFSDGSNAVEVRDGAGRWVFLGFDPRRIDIVKQPYLRISWRNQNRALSQILSNVGFPLSEPVATLIHSVYQTPLNIDVTGTGIARIKPYDAAKGAASTEDWKSFGLSAQVASGGDVLIEIRFTAPKTIPEGDLIADLGTIDDYDETSLNGQPIGSVTPDNVAPDRAWKTKRHYVIPAGLLKPGENVFTLHAWNRNAVAKGWPVLVRGPMKVHFAGDAASPYVGTYLRSDDPYLQRMW